MKKIILAFIVIALVIATLLELFYVNPPKNVEPEPALALVLKQTKGVAVVEKQFKAVGNLVGFLVHFKNNPTNQAIIYADKQGRYLLMGDIITKKGENLTIKQSHKYIHDELIQKAYDNLNKTHWIYQGKKNAKHLITVLIDPNSPLFPLEYQHLISYVDNGDLAVRWILVSYLKPFGDKRAAAILQAQNQVNALTYNEKQYNYDSQTGGIKPAAHVTRKTQKILEDNWNFMQKYKFSGTPVIFMQTKANQTYVMTGFLMDEMLEQVIDSLKSPKEVQDQSS